MKRFFLSIYSIAFLTLLLSGQRWSEAEIAEADIYIQASQKKMLGEYEEAVALYLKFLEKKPTNASALHDLARVYLAQENVEKAEASAKKAVRFDPETVWYKMTLGEIQERNLNYSAAAKTFHALAQSQNNIDLFNRWAQVLIKDNKNADAILALNQIDQKFGKTENRSDEKVDLYLKLGDKKAAIAEIESWTKENPNSVYYKIKLAKFYTFLREEKKAKKIFQNIIKDNPDNVEALLALQALEGDSGNAKHSSNLVDNDGLTVDQKIQAVLPIITAGSDTELQPLLPKLKELADNNAGHAPAQAAYADALYVLGDIEDAQLYYKKTIDIDPSNYQVWDQLMSLSDQLNQQSELFEMAERALDYFPNQSGPYYFLAKAAFSKGDMGEAQGNIEEALFINNTSDRSQILMAAIQEKEVGITAAIEWLENLNNRSANATEYMGDLYLKSGDKSKAQASYEAAIELGGVVQRLQQKIQSI